jgi:hypothetical protein
MGSFKLMFIASLVKSGQAVQILEMGKHTDRQTDRQMAIQTKYLNQLAFERQIDNLEREEYLNCQT